MVKTCRFNGCKEGDRSAHNKEMLCFFDTTLQKASSAALVLYNLDYFPVVWSSAARKYLVKLQLAQNRVARFALNCNQRADINTRETGMHSIYICPLIYNEEQNVPLCSGPAAAELGLSLQDTTTQLDNNQDKTKLEPAGLAF